MFETHFLRSALTSATILVVGVPSHLVVQNEPDALLRAVGAYVRAGAPNDTIRVSRSHFCSVSEEICSDKPAQLTPAELRALIAGAAADTAAPKDLMPSSPGILHLLLGKARVFQDSAIVVVWKGNHVDITVHQLYLAYRSRAWRVVTDRIVGGT